MTQNFGGTPAGLVLEIKRNPLSEWVPIQSITSRKLTISRTNNPGEPTRLQVELWVAGGGFDLPDFCLVRAYDVNVSVGQPYVRYFYGVAIDVRRTVDNTTGNHNLGYSLDCVGWDWRWANPRYMLTTPLQYGAAQWIPQHDYYVGDAVVSEPMNGHKYTVLVPGKSGEFMPGFRLLANSMLVEPDDTTPYDDFEGSAGALVLSLSGHFYTQYGTGAYSQDGSGHAVVGSNVGTPVFDVLDSGTSDVRVQVTLVGPVTSGQGVAIRVSSATNGIYLIPSVPSPHTGNYRLYTLIGGVETLVGSSIAVVPADGDVICLSAVGDDITVTINQVEHVTHTIAFNHLATEHGLVTARAGNACSWDNLVVSDPVTPSIAWLESGSQYISDYAILNDLLPRFFGTDGDEVTYDGINRLCADVGYIEFLPGETPADCMKKLATQIVTPQSFAPWVSRAHYDIGARIEPFPANGYYFQCLRAGDVGSDADVLRHISTIGAEVDDPVDGTGARFVCMGVINIDPAWQMSLRADNIPHDAGWLPSVSWFDLNSTVMVPTLSVEYSDQNVADATHVHYSTITNERTTSSYANRIYVFGKNAATCSDPGYKEDTDAQAAVGGLIVSYTYTDDSDQGPTTPEECDAIANHILGVMSLVEDRISLTTPYPLDPHLMLAGVRFGNVTSALIGLSSQNYPINHAEIGMSNGPSTWNTDLGSPFRTDRDSRLSRRLTGRRKPTNSSIPDLVTWPTDWVISNDLDPISLTRTVHFKFRAGGEANLDHFITKYQFATDPGGLWRDGPVVYWPAQDFILTGLPTVNLITLRVCAVNTSGNPQDIWAHMSTSPTLSLQPPVPPLVSSVEKVASGIIVGVHPTGWADLAIVSGAALVEGTLIELDLRVGGLAVGWQSMVAEGTTKFRYRGIAVGVTYTPVARCWVGSTPYPTYTVGTPFVIGPSPDSREPDEIIPDWPSSDITLTGGATVSLSNTQVDNSTQSMAVSLPAGSSVTAYGLPYPTKSGENFRGGISARSASAHASMLVQMVSYNKSNGTVGSPDEVMASQVPPSSGFVRIESKNVAAAGVTYMRPKMTITAHASLSDTIYISLPFEFGPLVGDSRSTVFKDPTLHQYDIETAPFQLTNAAGVFIGQLQYVDLGGGAGFFRLSSLNATGDTDLLLEGPDTTRLHLKNDATGFYFEGGAVNLPYYPVTTNTTVDGTNCVYMANSTSGNIIMTLPAASASMFGTRLYAFIKTDSSVHTVTVQCDTGDNILGSSSYVLDDEDEFLMLLGDGVHEWHVISKSAPALENPVVDSLTTTLLLAGGDAPSLTFGAGAGTGAAGSVVGNSVAGLIELTTGTGCVSNDSVMEVSPALGFDLTPFVVLTPANYAAVELYRGGNPVYVSWANSDEVQFNVRSSSTALDDSATYQWYYHCIGQQYIPPTPGMFDFSDPDMSGELALAGF